MAGTVALIWMACALMLTPMGIVGWNCKPVAVTVMESAQACELERKQTMADKSHSLSVKCVPLRALVE